MFAQAIFSFPPGCVKRFFNEPLRRIQSNIHAVLRQTKHRYRCLDREGEVITYFFLRIDRFEQRGKKYFSLFNGLRKNFENAPLSCKIYSK